MFLPMNRSEMRSLGWKELDVILVSGDAYIDAPQIGVAVIGKCLLAAGYRVGIIAQPDFSSTKDITQLGEPRLFWGVSGGSVDSMVANYTALMKKRRSDDYTPGGRNTRRPDRAVIVYSNLIRRAFKNTRPIVLGGIEASLRRIAHYDYWDDAIRRSLLFDAKADVLVYGMGETVVTDLARRFDEGRQIDDLAGICTIGRTAREDYVYLPSFEEARKDKQAFIRMFDLFYRNLDPLTARGLQQRHGDRWLLHHPPPMWETQQELDAVYSHRYERDQHPDYQKEGALRALDTIRFSLQTHRGCYGECNFCAIAVHEGRTVRSRSEASILAEAAAFRGHDRFRGVISDVGGPTANMYGYECDRKLRMGACDGKRCMYPGLCEQMPVDHSRYTRLLKKLKSMPGIRHVFVASGIRPDLVFADSRRGRCFVDQLVAHHVSGQLKIAPEHSDPQVLSLMGKGGIDEYLDFRRLFLARTKAAGKKQTLSYYFIAAYPGCDERHMQALRHVASKELSVRPEQVQIFTPTPSTWASVMYYTGMHPFTGEALQVERGLRGKRRQSDILLSG
jgi:uncharacterized radical SAM protein YgiQ